MTVDAYYIGPKIRSQLGGFDGENAQGSWTAN